METETKVMIAVISAGSAIAGAIFSQVVSIVPYIERLADQRK